ncbi:hypothetical protein [Streptomyces nigra]
MKRIFASGTVFALCAGALLMGCSRNECTGGSVCGAGNAVDLPSKASQKSPPSNMSARGGPLLVTHKWPTFKSCDGATSVAMPADGKALADFSLMQQDIRSEVTTPRNKGGVWGSGHLYLNLSAEGKETVTVDELHLTTRIPKKIDPPSWVALTQGGCGDVRDRVFNLDLDKPQLLDRGVEGTGEADPTEPPVRTNSLGSGFTVSATDPAIIRVDATACRGNYEWSLQIDYTYQGKALHKVVGPFRSFGAAGKEAKVYVPDLSTGEIGAATEDKGLPIGCPVQQ